MFSNDLSHIFVWWVVLFLLGIVFLPYTVRIFPSFFDKGYIFSKVLGMLVISYSVFLLGTIKLIPFGFTGMIFVVLASGFLAIYLLSKQAVFFLDEIKSSWRFFLLEELLFLFILVAWSFVRAHEPSIHGLEKFMDFGFVNSVLQTEYFPAKDIWLTPLSINYYYFGHLITAVLTKLSGLSPAITYNLMIATLCAFCFTCAFSIAANLIKQFQISNFPSDRAQGEGKFQIYIGGLLAGFLVTFAGNLHTIYAFFNSYDGENPVPFWMLSLDWQLDNYWYPNATRFIPFTIHEFPIYSFVVSDLHGHVLSIPIVLTIIAVLLQLFMIKKITAIRLIFVGFLLATAYMTNAWDGIIYFLLAILILFFLHLQLSASTQSVRKFSMKEINVQIFNLAFKFYALHFTLYVFLLGIAFVLFSMPFSMFFKPFVSGIGVICAPEFLTNIARLGPFLFEADHCQRSPLYQLIILHGFWYFWVLSLFLFLLSMKKTKSASESMGDLFVIILIGLSTLLILLSEFIYAKDIYPGHYRANTMFKLGYEAFIMLGISTAYIIIRLISNFQFQIYNFKRFSWKLMIVLVVGGAGLLLVGIYPQFAINSYYGNLKTYRGLYGLTYLQELYPSDYDGIRWIAENIQGQPVILEGVGESYTDYARVSANTGMPTVLGWPVHEWLWRGTYDEAGKRVVEVERMYTSADVNEVKELFSKYDVAYIFVGQLERQKYPALNEGILQNLGEPVYKNGQTVIYKVY